MLKLSKNALTLTLLFAVAGLICGCDFNPIRDLIHGSSDSNTDFAANFLANGMGSCNVTVTPTASFVNSCTLSNANVGGPSHTSFLPPEAPSAVGNPLAFPAASGSFFGSGIRVVP